MGLGWWWRRKTSPWPTPADALASRISGRGSFLMETCYCTGLPATLGQGGCSSLVGVLLLYPPKQDLAALPSVTSVA